MQFVLLATAWWLNTRGEDPNQLSLARQAGTDVKMTLGAAEAAASARQRPAGQRDPARSRSGPGILIYREHDRRPCARPDAHGRDGTAGCPGRRTAKPGGPAFHRRRRPAMAGVPLSASDADVDSRWRRHWP